MATHAASIDRVAREAFGYEALRPGQREAIEAVLSGRDTLAVMSTGSGKSAIYQIAGLLRPGTTVVISPLIALQRDQVEDLRERVGGNAAQLNSTLSASEREQALGDLADDALEFLFLAPEQLANEDVLDELAVAGISLLVVDEAHCISEWGHDFRPDYLRLGSVIEALDRPVVLALTATAAPPVREEIEERLGMREPALIVRGFDRPNIHLEVDRFHSESSHERTLIDRIEQAAKPGIVYTATRRRSEELAEALEERGVKAIAYHAGLRDADRTAAQERFMDDEVDVVVATTAFGMGIDKPNVRFVFHAEPADSVDSYFQEIGRAGRDGEAAEAVLFYRPEDLGVRRFFAGSGQVDVEDIARVAEVVADADGPVAPSELKDETDLSQSKLTTAVSRLEDVGAVEVLPSGDVAEAEEAPARHVAVEEAAEAQEQRRQFDRSRIDMMRAYAEADACRRAFLLSYFGEPYDPPCGNCDFCDAHGDDAAAPAQEDVPFAVGSRVRHDQWGEGAVQRYENDSMTVLFDDVGYKTLALSVVAERGLLEPT
jgi:ATP-dependent DNA helicase RecQ